MNDTGVARGNVLTAARVCAAFTDRRDFIGPLGLGTRSTGLSTFRSWVGAAVLVASTSFAPIAFAEPDVVYLNGGGEVRGAVMSRDASTGVVLRLVDGTIRTIPESEISYVGRPGTGGVNIDGEEPGRLTLQDEVHGRTPFEMGNLSPGTYRVKVEFDGGGTSETEVVLRVGQIERVKVPLPEIRRMSKDQGWALSGGPLLGISNQDDGLYGIGVMAGRYVALTPTLEFRISLGFYYIDIADLSGPEFNIVPALRLNLSAGYAMEFGLQVGATSIRDYPDTKLEGAVGIRGSFASLRFGERRQIELTLWHSLCSLVDLGETEFETGISFGFLTI